MLLQPHQHNELRILIESASDALLGLNLKILIVKMIYIAETTIYCAALVDNGLFSFDPWVWKEATTTLHCY